MKEKIEHSVSKNKDCAIKIKRKKVTLHASVLEEKVVGSFLQRVAVGYLEGIFQEGLPKGKSKERTSLGR